MRKIVGTSDKFTGEIVIIYRDDHRLALIEFTGAELTDNQRQVVKDCTPVVFDYEGFNAAFMGKPISFVEVSMRISFKQFWERYNRKIHPHLCEPKWDKLSDADTVKAFYGIWDYEGHLQRTGQFKANPLRYIKDRFWLTDYKKA